MSSDTVKNLYKQANDSNGTLSRIAGESHASSVLDDAESKIGFIKNVQTAEGGEISLASHIVSAAPQQSPGQDLDLFQKETQKPSTAGSTSCGSTLKSRLKSTMEVPLDNGTMKCSTSTKDLDLLTPQEAISLEKEIKSQDEAAWKAEVAKRKQEIREAFRQFLKDKFGCPLKTWLRYFDKGSPSDGVQLGSFSRSLVQIGWDTKVYSSDDTFHALDVGRCYEVALEDIDMELARVWQSFRIWCATNFTSPMDAMQKVARRGGDGRPIDINTFCEGLQRNGWELGHENKLFRALDMQDSGLLSAGQFKWVDPEKRRLKKMEQAKEKALWERERHKREIVTSHMAIDDFRKFLRRKFGCLVRAWRSGLDRDGTMSVPRHELFKACSEVGWKGDVRALWRALDADDSGITNLEELDHWGATVLAHFRDFLYDKFGSACAGFRAFDPLDLKYLREPDFTEACKKHGFDRGTFRPLFRYLDWRNEKRIMEADFEFLDVWNPPPYLVAQPNETAAKEFKKLILKREGNYLKAFRSVLDQDGSNRVSWREFFLACEEIGFSGDAPGAWAFMDNDHMGAITLRKIDTESNEAIMVFKRWTDDVFGGIKSAFTVLNEDGNDKLSYREFRTACRAYRFPGDAVALFDSLDMDGGGSLALNELAFLDNWETEGVHYNWKPPSTPSTDPDHHRTYYMGNLKSKVSKATYSSGGTEYRTSAPGPGTYERPDSLGCRPNALWKNGGSYSFRRKLFKNDKPGFQPMPQLVGGVLGVVPKTPPAPSPAQYDVLNGLKTTTVKNKPRCFFGSSGRGTPPGQRRTSTNDAPGPGAYDHKSTLGGPGFSILSRKIRCRHPLDDPAGRSPRSAATVLDGRTRRIL